MTLIDPGKQTGYAEYQPSNHKLVAVATLQIHQAMHHLIRCAHNRGESLRVVIEDARLRTWFGSADARQKRSGAGIREGVGSVKRDCTIWEDFLTDLGVSYQLMKPAAGGTKWNAEKFNRLTGWTWRTSEHGRDAALLIWGRKS